MVSDQEMKRGDRRLIAPIYLMRRCRIFQLREHGGERFSPRNGTL